MAEIAENVREGLALAVDPGLQAMHAMMAEDVTAVCGPKGKHDTARTASIPAHACSSRCTQISFIPWMTFPLDALAVDHPRHAAIRSQIQVGGQDAMEQR